MPKLASSTTKLETWLATYWAMPLSFPVHSSSRLLSITAHGISCPTLTSFTSVKQGTTTGLDLTFAGRDSNFAMRFEAYLPIDQAGDYRFFIGRMMAAFIHR